MKHSKHILFLSSIFCLLFYGCCKDEPSCDGIKETKAYFEGYNLNDNHLRNPHYPRIENDTNFSYMTFVAFDVEDAIYYKWIIGAEEIENQPMVYRSGFPRNVWIPITLIVQKKPNTACFPKDDGIDTITKSYIFTDNKWRWYREDGSYLYCRGSFAHKPNDSFTFYFSTDKYKKNFDYDTIYDFPCKGAKSLWYWFGESNYNSINGSCGISDNIWKCDTVYPFYFSYKKNGNEVYLKCFFKNRKDSFVFNGYQVK